MNYRRTQWLLTGVAMVILGAMEVYVPSVAESPETTKIVVKDFMFNLPFGLVIRPADLADLNVPSAAWTPLSSKVFPATKEWRRSSHSHGL